MNGMTPMRVTRAIRNAISALSRGLTPGDLASNWVEEDRQTFLSWMHDLERRATYGEDVRDDCMSIIRNLDVSGIHGGSLHDAVLAVQHAWQDAP